MLRCYRFLSLAQLHSVCTCLRFRIVNPSEWLSILNRWIIWSICQQVVLKWLWKAAWPLEIRTFCERAVFRKILCYTESQSLLNTHHDLHHMNLHALWHIHCHTCPDVQVYAKTTHTRCQPKWSNQPPLQQWRQQFVQPNGKKMIASSQFCSRAAASWSISWECFSDTVWWSLQVVTAEVASMRPPAAHCNQSIDAQLAMT